VYTYDKEPKTNLVGNHVIREEGYTVYDNIAYHDVSEVLSGSSKHNEDVYREYIEKENGYIQKYLCGQEK